MPVVDEFSGCVLGRGPPRQGQAWAQAHRTRAQGSLTLHANWAMVALDPEQGVFTPNRSRGMCPKVLPKCMGGFWEPQLHFPGWTGDIINTRWDQPRVLPWVTQQEFHWAFLSSHEHFYWLSGWSKIKVYSYSFYDIHQCPLSLGKRSEEHSEMQCAISHTNSSWIILQELQFWSPRKGPWITGILILKRY